MFIYFFLKSAAVLLAVAALLYILVQWMRKLPKRIKMALLILLVAAGIFFFASLPYPIHFAMPPTMQSMAPGKFPASIPFLNALTFLFDSGRFERVGDISADPNDVPVSPQKPEGGIVKIALTAQEVIAEVGPGIYFNYWTYNKQVPGPFFRVRAGDTVEVALTNHPSSLHEHNIDLHSVTGPGGGAVLTKAKPGETKTFQWKALNPGLYVYHCATPNVSTHNAHGQYGLILVEPKGGLPRVDKEFYVMQGELYTEGGIGKKGLAIFDSNALLDGNPTYVTFNGKLEQAPRMEVKIGDRVRMYVGNGGVNLVSSFHVIGEIFDIVYPEGAIGSAPHKNIQTTLVPVGGSTIVEFTAEVPGNYVLVDHALSRLNKGAWAIMKVLGNNRPDIFK